ncbi:thioesterase II family protein [Actinoplanes auranticolor]|nr:alpha/beta fold hydrolase [Actinoplanes auranticolor]
MTDPWLRVHRPRPDASRQLVCFPHAGGSAAVYRSWADELPPTIEMAVVQYPGRHDRYAEPLPTDLPALAADIVPAVLARAHRRTAFFGHSMGATVAFEVARRMTAVPDRLFVSARKAPSAAAGPVPPVSQRTTPDDDEQLRHELRRIGGASPAWLDDDELWALVLPVLRNDSRMSRAYHYRQGPPLTCPITAIVGDADQAVGPADAARWRMHTVGGFDLRVLPGDHFYYRHSLPPLIQLLSSWGSRASQPTGKVR